MRNRRKDGAMTEFCWWRVSQYGMAEPHADTPATRALVDTEPRGWYGNVEGTIIHGGVLATAYKRRTEQTYDARVWLATGEMVSAGEITTTEITAQREA